MAERRIALILEAKVQNFLNGWKGATRANEEFEQSTKNADKATKQASKSAEERAQKIKVVAEADQRAAKAAGLLYSANGQLVNSNGKVVSSAQAAAHGVDAFSEAVYLANQEAQESAAKTEASVKKQAEAYKTLAPAVTIAGGALTLAFGKMITTYADFDKSMSEVQAATHETTGNMNLLREAAVGAGADTAFSASEAAGGIKELAKAGVDTQAILGGGLSGALNLAATDNIAVAKAAEIAASAMTQFKLSGEAVPHIADLLAAGAGKAQGGVEDLGAALNQSGLVANSVGLTIEEATGSLTAFAAAGLTGSDSGTSFKTMLQSLTPNSKQAAQLMDELNISAYDAQGSFIGMSEYAGVLQSALKDMSDEERNANLKIMFGSDAVRAANVLYEEGAAGIQKWEEAVNDAGYAAVTAAAMQDNLAGDLEKLGGAIDTVFLKSGSGANDALRGLVQTAESFIDTIGKIPEPILSTLGILTGLTGVTALAGGALVTFVPRAMETVQAFKDLSANGKAVPGIFGKVGKAAGLAAGGFLFLQAAVAANNAQAPDVKSVQEYADAYLRVRNEIWNVNNEFKTLKFAEGSNLEGDVNNVGDAIAKLNPKFGDVRGHLASFGDTVLGAQNGLPQLRGELEGMSDMMAKAVQGGDYEGASKVFREMADSAKQGGQDMSDLTPYMQSYMDSLREVGQQSGVTLSDQQLLNWALSGTKPAAVEAAEGAQLTTEALDEVGVSAEGVVEDMQEFLDILFQAGVITRDERAALREYEASIDAIGDSIEKNGKSLDVHTEKGRANQAAFDDLAASGEAYVRALAEGGATEEELQSAMSSTYESLITAAGQFGITGEAADEMAREVMGIPDDVKVDSWMSDQAKKTAEATKKSIEEIPTKHDVRIVQTFETHGVPYAPTNPLRKQLNSSLPSNKLPGMADGGDLDMAPGPVGVDSMLFMGARGEHMLTAEDVKAMGGQQSVYRFRSQLHSSLVRGYANGGEIGTPSVSVMQASSVPVQSSGNSSQALLDATVYDATDATRVAREVADLVFTMLRKETRRNG